MSKELDDELALFQAEIASLDTEPTKKRTAEMDLEEIARKRQKAMEVANKILQQASIPEPSGPKAPIQTVIVRAPSKRIDKVDDIPIAPVLRMDQPSAPNVSIMHGQSVPMASSVQLELMIDHKTGLPLTTKEQLIFNQQQSVYRYKPQHNFSKGQPVSDKKFVRAAAGKVWEDSTLSEWPENDFRLFCGDLGNEVTDDLLSQAFSIYSSFAMARVVRDKITHKSKGFGFVSFIDGLDAMKALREMNGKYIGSRPVKLTKGKWQERSLEVVKKKGKKKNKHLF